MSLLTEYGRFSWYRYWERQWEEPPEDMWCDYGDDELPDDPWEDGPFPAEDEAPFPAEDDPWAAAASARDWHKEADDWLNAEAGRGASRGGERLIFCDYKL